MITRTSAGELHKQAVINVPTKMIVYVLLKNFLSYYGLRQ